ncbi:MAG TPA: SpoIID/LytB domain-containing protein, partial [Vicinamibacterales bacterium]|nr:SpoIID/LytB domain-containing protein [Vicinamibacterales bacterium]
MGPSLSQASENVLRIGATTGEGRTRIESIQLEDYVARVIAGEGQPRAPDAAQEALAIAVRTFALANLHRHRREGFDLCDTTHCQVLGSATAAAARAAQATAGRVLVYHSQPAAIFYSAWCGGRSELASDVWPGAIDYAFEPSQTDDACDDEPGWSAEISMRTIESALRVAGLKGTRLRELRVLSRNSSGRVSELRADGFSPSEISGDDFRLAIARIVGPRQLKSTLFQLQRAPAGYLFTGRGFGHGVGLCVIGAGRRAAKGATADQILGFYYPGLQIETYSSLSTAVAARSPAPAAPRPTPSAPRVTDVLLTLSGPDESERGTVLQLVRRARDQLASAIAVTAPREINVTVHPSVESFARATGQPWWVSGASDDNSIDLVPVSLLRQRGQLERAIRLEVAHVLLDGRLSTRPIWVREGAASYFAGPSGAERPAKTICPSDGEFLRPLSANAHRD